MLEQSRCEHVPWIEVSARIFRDGIGPFSALWFVGVEECFWNLIIVARTRVCIN